MSRSNCRYLLICSLLLGGGPGFSAENLNQRERELAAVNTVLADIQAWLEQANLRQSDEEKRLRLAEQEIGTLSLSVASLNSAIARTGEELRSLQARSERLQADKAAQSEILMQFLRAAYMAGGDSTLKLLLNQRNPAEADRMQYYYRHFGAAQLETLAAYRATLAEIDRVNENLRAKLNELNDRQRRVNSELSALNEARAQRETALANLSADIADRRRELEQRRIDRDRLEQLIEQINDALDGFPRVEDGTRFTARRGELPLPAGGPIVHRFGTHYAGGDLARQGITIGLETGTPVRAVHPGRVVFADWLRGAGLLVILDHGDGYMSLYGNNQALAVAPGAWVEAGRIIATSGQVPGSGGNAGVDGLYFEIRHRGAAQDPANWLRPPGAVDRQ